MFDVRTWQLEPFWSLAVQRVCSGSVQPQSRGQSLYIMSKCDSRSLKWHVSVCCLPAGQLIVLLLADLSLFRAHSKMRVELVLASRAWQAIISRIRKPPLAFAASLAKFLKQAVQRAQIALLVSSATAARLSAQRVQPVMRLKLSCFSSFN